MVYAQIPRLLRKRSNAKILKNICQTPPIKGQCVVLLICKMRERKYDGNIYKGAVCEKAGPSVDSPMLHTSLSSVLS
jgi:hypothetical protein